MIRRLRTARKTSLAVGGILALPLFFAGLMASSLAVEKPSVRHVLRHGTKVAVPGDPAGVIELKIWLLAAVPCVAIVLVGLGSVLLGRAGVAVTALAGIAISIALIVPLGHWAKAHSNRFPVGVDLIPPSAGSQDIYLKGEWEGNAKRTARQLGSATIGISVVALAALGLLELRRRRAAPAPSPSAL